MDYKRREELFAKEALHISDIQELFGMKYDCAAKIIRDMKLKRQIQGRSLRLDVDGYIHTADYLEEIGFDPTAPGERYCKKKEKSAGERYFEKTPTKRKSLCV